MRRRCSSGGTSLGWLRFGIGTDAEFSGRDGQSPFHFARFVLLVGRDESGSDTAS